MTSRLFHISDMSVNILSPVMTISVLCFPVSIIKQEKPDELGSRVSQLV